MRFYERLLLAIAILLFGCATSHSSEADLKASSEKKEELAGVTHSETKIAEHGGSYTVRRWFFRGPSARLLDQPLNAESDQKRGDHQPAAAALGVPDGHPEVEAGAGEMTGGEEWVHSPFLTEYEVEVHDGVDKTFMRSSDGQFGAEVATSSAVQADSKSASQSKPASILGLSWGWWVLGLVALAAFLGWRLLPFGEWLRRLRGQG